MRAKYSHHVRPYLTPYMRVSSTVSQQILAIIRKVSTGFHSHVKPPLFLKQSREQINIHLLYKASTGLEKSCPNNYPPI